jgi:hypothetical protein
MTENGAPPSEIPASEPRNPSGRLSPGATLAVCAAGWLVPGLGHLCLKRWGRGLVFAAGILTMFGLGLAMQGRLYGMVPEQPLHLFAFAANAGTGLAYVLARNLDWGIGVLSSPNYDYGSTYLWVAGLLNYRVMLDTFDIARGRKA